MTKQEACQILNVTPTTPMQDVKRSYRNLAKKYHPDLNPLGHDKFCMVEQAYRVLTGKEVAETGVHKGSMSITFSSLNIFKIVGL